MGAELTRAQRAVLREMVETGQPLSAARQWNGNCLHFTFRVGSGPHRREYTAKALERHEMIEWREVDRAYVLTEAGRQEAGDGR